MILIKSFIKIGDEFYELEQLTEENLVNIDREYVQGIIKIFTHKHILIGSDIIDDINWFWGYVAYNFESYFEKGIYSIGYPSQPIDFQIIFDSPKFIRLKIYDRYKTYAEEKLPRLEFLLAFLSEAKKYFEFESLYSTECKEDILIKSKKIDEFIKKIN